MHFTYASICPAVFIQVFIPRELEIGGAGGSPEQGDLGHSLMQPGSWLIFF